MLMGGEMNAKYAVISVLQKSSFIEIEGLYFKRTLTSYLTNAFTIKAAILHQKEEMKSKKA